MGRRDEWPPLGHLRLWPTDSAWKQLVLGCFPSNLSLLWLFYFYFWFLKLKKKSSICHLQEFAVCVAEDGKRGLLRRSSCFYLKLAIKLRRAQTTWLWWDNTGVLSSV